MLQNLKKEGGGKVGADIDWGEARALRQSSAENSHRESAETMTMEKTSPRKTRPLNKKPKSGASLREDSRATISGKKPAR